MHKTYQSHIHTCIHTHSHLCSAVLTIIRQASACHAASVQDAMNVLREMERDEVHVYVCMHVCMFRHDDICMFACMDHVWYACVA